MPGAYTYSGNVNDFLMIIFLFARSSLMQLATPPSL